MQESEDSEVGAFQCSQCQLVFGDAGEHREHHKSELHRQNLKRRVAGLIPLKPEAFQARRRALEQQSAQQRPSPQHCDLCRKSFSSTNAYEQHCNSKKHLKKQKEAPEGQAAQSSGNKSEQPSEQPSEELTEELTEEQIIERRIATAVRFEFEQCFFCPEACDTVEANMQHMEKYHGLFVPDLEYLIDLDGLLRYLADKISVGYTCLWCNKPFDSLHAVQQHMTATSHCKFNFDEDEAEYIEFYDYSEAQAEGGPLAEPNVEVDSTGYALVFKDSGKRVGHRALKQYYKQNLKPYEEKQVVVRALQRYKDRGWKTSEERRMEERARLHKLQQTTQHYKQQVKGNKARNLRLKRTDLTF